MEKKNILKNFLIENQKSVVYMIVKATLISIIALGVMSTIAGTCLLISDHYKSGLITTPIGVIMTIFSTVFYSGIFKW